MKFISIFACAFILSTTTASADAARIGAGIFKRACLNKLALELTAGSSIEMGIDVASEAQVHFEKDATKAQRAGLVGRPRYNFSIEKKEGRFSCHVSSKHLTADEITPHFSSLSRKASKAFGTPEYGKAAVDGDPSAQAEGLRSTFRSDGLIVVLEAIYFVSARGPVGSYAISIEHHTE